MKRPVGDAEPESIARTVCRELGYLCFDSAEAEKEAAPLIVSELAILETYNFIARSLSPRPDYRPVLECLRDDNCIHRILDTVNEVLDLYLGKRSYFFNISLDELRDAVKIAEKLAHILDKEAESRENTEGKEHKVADQGRLEGK